ncbi:MAG: Fe-S cluster assembly ATPase SufC [Nanoarchaeota archaeon]|nr:Fe-S cluster assembly ATPase SufC [Nanoarchaeota archaeon]
MIEIKNLHVEVKGKEILKGVNLKLKKGEINALMGPNGSGKSTLVNTIMGHPKYQIKKGEILFNNKKINDLSPNEKAKLGIFLSFQAPRELEGIEIKNFLKQTLKSLKEEKLSPIEFNKKLKEILQKINLDENILKRDLNKNFSGGEKKKLEILQMILYDPRLILLDEADSGLDIDSLKTISEGIKTIMNKEKTLFIITHYKRILEHISPDKVFIMKNGKIVQEGNSDLIHKVEKEGYDWINGK